MLKKVLVGAVALALTAGAANAGENKFTKEEGTGLFTGAAAGALVGGPIGAAVGLMIGGILGDSVGSAKRADKQARKLAKTLSLEARAKFEARTAGAHDDVRAARGEVRARPMRARRMARRAARQLEHASIVATTSGDARRRALAEADAKKRAKTIKQRNAQAKQAGKMAKFVALHTVTASVTTPSDTEVAEKQVKQARRRARTAS